MAVQSTVCQTLTCGWHQCYSLYVELFIAESFISTFVPHSSTSYATRHSLLASAHNSQEENGRVGFHFGGHTVMQSIEIQRTFRRDISPPSQGPANKLNKIVTWTGRKCSKGRAFRFLPHGRRISLLARLVLHPADGGDPFVLNVGRLATDYTALYSRK
jgi:hypothetical protein